MTCDICAYADEHGSWPVPHLRTHTHCRRCHGSWPHGTNIQHCAVCCRTFTNIGAADLHRARGTGECLNPLDVRDRDGEHRLTLSTRRHGPRTTVAIWARAERRDSRHSLRVPGRSVSGGSGRHPVPAEPTGGNP